MPETRGTRRMMVRDLPREIRRYVFRYRPSWRRYYLINNIVTPVSPRPGAPIQAQRTHFHHVRSVGLSWVTFTLSGCTGGGTVEKHAKNTTVNSRSRPIRRTMAMGFAARLVMMFVSSDNAWTAWDRRTRDFDLLFPRVFHCWNGCMSDHVRKCARGLTLQI